MSSDADGDTPRGSSRRQILGGVIHGYQKYNPQKFARPTQPAPDVVSGAFDHLLQYGSTRELTEEELARAVEIDPSQIAGLGPSIDGLLAMLRERMRKILGEYETTAARDEADKAYAESTHGVQPPKRLRKRFDHAVRTEQLREFDRLWYMAEGEDRGFAARLLHIAERLGEKYEIDEMISAYDFTGRTPMTVPEALQIKEELDAIAELIRQLEQARETAQIGIINLDKLGEFAEPSDIDGLRALNEQVQEYLKNLAEQQGLEATADGYRLTPDAYRLFQSKLLDEIFSDLQAARRGRHTGPIEGEGAVELPTTKPYEFGDSVANMDMPQSLINAMIRELPADGRINMRSDDIEIHRTRNTPKCATAVVMDMSGSMRYGGQYINVKRMALALDGLIRREYPGDFLQFIEMYTVGKPRHLSEVASLMPRPVSIHDPVVRLAADMSDARLTEFDLPLHFTNIQHSMQLARRFLNAQDTPNRQLILITDGLPTAHFEEEMLYMLYPPHPRTEAATMREAMACKQEDIVINIFLLANWSQSEEDVQFAHRMVEATGGRVFFTAGRDLDRYVVWDYVKRRRKIIG